MGTVQRVSWLHLSDFHVGMDAYAQRELFKEVLHEVRRRQKSGTPLHMVFITGDLANKGLKSEYDQFAEQFLLPLTDSVEPKNIFCVPGNHDANRKVARFSDRTTIQKQSVEFFDVSQEGKNERAEIIGRFGAYIAADLSATGGAWLTSPEGTYAEVRTFDGIRVGIVGINTAW